jgi:isocitrate dehydrogenase
VSHIGSDFLFIYSLIDGKEEQIDLEVFNFTGAGGVALSMYNTDEVLLFLYLFCIVTKFKSHLQVFLSAFP